MPRDASLTDFAPPDGADDGPSDATDDPTPDGSNDSASDGSDDAPDPRASTDDGAAEGAEDEGERPTPARPTYEWTPRGTACAACGERTPRRWRQGDDLVCPDCKTW